MSEEEEKKAKNSLESADSEKGTKKRKHDETAPMSIPSTSAVSNPDLPPWVAGGSPVKFIAPEELLNMSVAMDNLALVHEIAVDPNFRIENVEASPIEKVIRENMLRAYWDLLREDLAKDPPSYEEAFKRLIEIKQEILENMLSERHVRLRAEVEYNLNEEKLKDQLHSKNLDVKAVALFILELLGRLCCPERDEMIEKLRQEDGIVELISGIFQLIDIMKNDLTNFAISQNRRAVEDHSAKMEYETYLKYLEKFPEGSKKTKAWLKKAYLELFSKAAEPAAKKEKGISEQDLYMKVTARAYLNLIRHLEADPFPETMRIDQPKCQTYAYNFLQLTITASVVLVTCNGAGREVSEAAGFKAFLKERLLALSNDLHTRPLSQVLDDFFIQCVKDSKDQAVKLGSALSPQQQNSIESQIKALNSDSHSVRSLVYNRIGSFIEAILTNPTGSSHPLGAGLSMIEKDLCPLTAKMLRIASHNRKTFEVLYMKLIAEVVEECETSAEQKYGNSCS